jgi:hypothetical protein
MVAIKPSFIEDRIHEALKTFVVFSFASWFCLSMAAPGKNE